MNTIALVLDPLVQYVLEAMWVGFLVLLGAGGVALWLDYRAGVFVETHICEACGYEASLADSIFCRDCDAHANDLTEYARVCLNCHAKYYGNTYAVDCGACY